MYVDPFTKKLALLVKINYLYFLRAFKSAVLIQSHVNIDERLTFLYCKLLV